MIERLARAIADFIRRREDAAERRRVARRALEQAQVEARVTAEAASEDERLDLARRIWAWATVFVLMPEGRWVFEHWWHWRVAWTLSLDAQGRLWQEVNGNTFGKIRPRLIGSPEELARMYSTAKLQDAVRATEEDCWAQALSRSLARLLLPRGRLV